VLHRVVAVLGIGLEGELGLAATALDVETKDLDAQIVLVLDGFLACVEFLSLILVRCRAGERKVGKEERERERERERWSKSRHHHQ
jgi:hypothetical protein